MSKHRAVAFTRTYTWGPSLKIEASLVPGGVSGAVDRIHRAVGEVIGVRNTFTKLFALDGPPAPDSTDGLRARLLVQALGLDPAEWRVENVELPTAIDPEKLSDEVGRSFRWTAEHAGQELARAS